MMLAMDYDIRIDDYKLGMVDSIIIKKSVETVSDTATITLPASYVNKSLNVEKKLREGNAVSIKLGYNKTLLTEFKGYLISVKTTGGSISIECEDNIYLFRHSIHDREYKNITVNALLHEIVREADIPCTISCDYDFIYDTYVVKSTTGRDVLKNLQEETKANIYLRDNVLHMHPQYSEIFNNEVVIYDFSVNVERSDLLYKRADERKYFVEVEGIAKNGERLKTSVGSPSGEKRSLKLYGITNMDSLRKRAEEELHTIVYTGFEGSFTGWLIPYCEPAYKIELRDSECADKNGVYYVVSTETKFSSAGGERNVTIGKKIG